MRSTVVLSRNNSAANLSWKLRAYDCRTEPGPSLESSEQHRPRLLFMQPRLSITSPGAAISITSPGAAISTTSPGAAISISTRQILMLQHGRSSAVRAARPQKIPESCPILSARCRKRVQHERCARTSNPQKPTSVVPTIQMQKDAGSNTGEPHASLRNDTLRTGFVWKIMSRSGLFLDCRRNYSARWPERPSALAANVMQTL
jgi:hypothetical protein